jgi:hypothetical protein
MGKQDCLSEAGCSRTRQHPQRLTLFGVEGRIERAEFFCGE